MLRYANNIKRGIGSFYQLQVRFSPDNCTWPQIIDKPAMKISSFLLSSVWCFSKSILPSLFFPPSGVFAKASVWSMGGGSRGLFQHHADSRQEIAAGGAAGAEGYSLPKEGGQPIGSSFLGETVSLLQEGGPYRGSEIDHEEVFGNAEDGPQAAWERNPIEIEEEQSKSSFASSNPLGKKVHVLCAKCCQRGTLVNCEKVWGWSSKQECKEFNLSSASKDCGNHCGPSVEDEKVCKPIPKGSTDMAKVCSKCCERNRSGLCAPKGMAANRWCGLGRERSLGLFVDSDLVGFRPSRFQDVQAVSMS